MMDYEDLFNRFPNALFQRGLNHEKTVLIQPRASLFKYLWSLSPSTPCRVSRDRARGQGQSRYLKFGTFRLRAFSSDDWSETSQPCEPSANKTWFSLARGSRNLYTCQWYLQLISKLKFSLWLFPWRRWELRTLCCWSVTDYGEMLLQ